MTKQIQLKHHIYSMTEIYERYGLVRIWRDAVRFLGNETEAEAFLISPMGGFTLSDINEAKRMANRKVNQNS